MPAKSVAQRRLFAIAEHKPSELFKRDKSVGKLSKSTLREFSTTKEKGLPSRKMSRG